MPVIRLEYDDEIVSARRAREFANIFRATVVETTGRPESEVCLYGNASNIKLNVAAIQVWLEMSDYKVADADELTDNIRQQIAAWKVKARFEHQIKVTLTPMRWKVARPI